MAYSAYSGTKENLAAMVMASGKEVLIARFDVGTGTGEKQVEDGVQGMPIEEPFAPTMANSSAHTVTDAGTALLAANTNRSYALIQNTGATNNIYVGTTGVTTTTGFKLEPGASIPLSTQSAIEAICASGQTSTAVALPFTRA